MHKNLLKLTGICLILLSSLVIQAQEKPDELEIHALLENLFDGMREGDSAKVSVLFRKDVAMWTSYKDKEGNMILKRGELDQFLNAIGSPHDQIWDERLHNIKIEVDGNIAQVWTDYEFYVGEQFSHCGVDAFHLVKEDKKGWQILHLMDTRRKENCRTESP